MFAPGTRLGAYEVGALLGAGGMGEVYRAQDTRLGRNVAIKVLPEMFASDPERLARFEREAKTLASLNHPNIAQIYGVEESNDTRAIVMELVEGETLAERIARGSIPVKEALPIAKQVAEALEAAHEQGIVHRDLKPANIKLRDDGTVKVLDFGLAKLAESAATSTPQPAALSTSPTITSPALVSGVGVLLGTAAYMAPEQAKGRPADKRSDIWAFGCILFEMLAGQRAFDGEDVTDVLVAVLSKEPPWSAVPAGVPLRVQELLRRCLAKDVRQRRRDAGDLRIDIETMMAASLAPAHAVGSTRSPRLAWGVAALTTLGLASLAVVHFREDAPAPPPETRVDIVTGATPAPLDFALSPDGRSIVFVASGDGPARLWLRPLGQADARPLAGTENATMPFWSGDGRAIGYFADGKLYRVDTAGGAPQGLGTALPRGGAWNDEGTILFSPSATSAILKIHANGGEPIAATRLEPQQIAHRHPRFLPDGRRFLYWATGTPETTGVYLASLDGGQSSKLVAAESGADWLGPDWIVFQRQAALLVQQVDLSRGAVIGDPIRIATPVAASTYLGQPPFSVSRDGRIAYRASGAGLRQLTWYDRSGKSFGSATQADPGGPLYPELSPDDRRAVFYRVVQNNPDIWISDLARNAFSRFTFDPGIDTAPLWSPDGNRIVFASSRNGPQPRLYVAQSERAGSEQLLLDEPGSPLDWSNDGALLIYSVIDPTTGRDLWVLPMASASAKSGDAASSQTSEAHKPFALVRTSFEELNAQFSPDARWVAYETNESGQFEIVVQPFPDVRGKWQVSNAGGIQPRWRADGKELYFVSPDQKLMAVPVTTTGATFSAGPPMALFQARIAPGVGTNKQQYAVSRDGRFLIDEPIDQSSSAPITLILNWKAPAK